MSYVLCPVCGEVCALDGTNGVLIHILAFHAESEMGRAVMRELARLPLPESVR